MHLQLSSSVLTPGFDFSWNSSCILICGTPPDVLVQEGVQKSLSAHILITYDYLQLVRHPAKCWFYDIMKCKVYGVTWLTMCTQQGHSGSKVLTAKPKHKNPTLEPFFVINILGLVAVDILTMLLKTTNCTQVVLIMTNRSSELTRVLPTSKNQREAHYFYLLRKLDRTIRDTRIRISRQMGTFHGCHFQTHMTLYWTEASSDYSTPP